MKLYELILDTEDDADSGVFALSLVADPAIEASWVYFSKSGKQQIKFATVDNDKRTIVAPVLIPDMQILRIDEYSGEEYKVYFTKDTVEQLAQKYLQNGYQNKATFEHLENIDGEVTVVESWVSKSSTKDKSALYFNRAFPIGTWFVTMRVNSETLWQDYIKTGIVKAISLEGIFDHKLIRNSKVESILEKDIDTLNESEARIVLSKIKDILELEVGVPHYTADGKLYEGPTHKDASGRLMTGATHTEDSEYLYHKDELEAQPTTDSSYPGQVATGSIAPSTL
jgi:hypothetical protein